jgi:hypothetical protein
VTATLTTNEQRDLDCVTPTLVLKPVTWDAAFFLFPNWAMVSAASANASLRKPGRTGHFLKQAILSPAGRWILPAAFSLSSRCGLNAQSDWRPLMVSIDHFRQELLVQLRRAATEGRIDILINSGELCRTIPGSCSWSASCCDAMQEELKLGDTLVLDRTNGPGMTVRYLLPRD